MSQSRVSSKNLSRAQPWVQHSAAQTETEQLPQHPKVTTVGTQTETPASNEIRRSWWTLPTPKVVTTCTGTHADAEEDTDSEHEERTEPLWWTQAPARPSSAAPPLYQVEDLPIVPKANSPRFTDYSVPGPSTAVRNRPLRRTYVAGVNWFKR